MGVGFTAGSHTTGSRTGSFNADKTDFTTTGKEQEPTTTTFPGGAQPTAGTPPMVPNKPDTKTPPMTPTDDNNKSTRLETPANTPIAGPNIMTANLSENPQPYDVVPYRPSNSPLENHHGVLDVWAKNNIQDYVSRGADTPTIVLTKEQHEATKAVYRDWLYERTGKKVGGQVDWKEVPPQEIQRLTERMFDAAKVPQPARDEYFKALNKYIYRG